VGAAKAAFRLARRNAEAPRRPWQRAGVYALYVVVGYVFVLGPLTTRARGELLETFVVPSASMAPTVLPGDRVLADKTVGNVGGLKIWRGAIAVFVYPNDRSAMFVKRIVGLPGDRIELDGRRVVVNGKDLSAGEVPPSEVAAAQPAVAAVAAREGLVIGRERGDQGTYEVLWPRDATTPPESPTTFVVPGGQVFVLGDNRSRAVDSRRFGTVPLADVKAVVRQVWFSSHAGDGIRWGRIGKLLQ